MTKRDFRAPPASTTPDAPGYPTLDRFDQSRRSFLSKLGLALLGAGSLGAGVISCGGERAVGGEPDLPQLAGVAPPPDARIDKGAPSFDGGIGPMPDARVDPELPMSGAAPMPDALVDKPDATVPGPDAGPGRADFGGLPGEPPMPDARIDRGK
ncbi:MAG: hypothetical protein KAI47_18085 [Deltaproteobacteria bacterium]|nr:hypothetical protein [Deltaproteobacteria bacterium]